MSTPRSRFTTARATLLFAAALVLAAVAACQAPAPPEPQTMVDGRAPAIGTGVAVA